VSINFFLVIPVCILSYPLVIPRICLNMTSTTLFICNSCVFNYVGTESFMIEPLQRFRKVLSFTFPFRKAGFF